MNKVSKMLAKSEIDFSRLWCEHSILSFAVPLNPFNWNKSLKRMYTKYSRFCVVLVVSVFNSNSNSNAMNIHASCVFIF